MKISIITVAFNSAHTIQDTLRSVAAQDYPDIEHIVIDGGSTDKTVGVVKSSGAHVAMLVSEPDRGIYDAMNKGLALATGDAVGFLNSDDLLASPGSISSIVGGFTSDAVDGVYGDLVFVDPMHLDTVTRYWRPGRYKAGACAKGWMAPHPAFYVRREVLERAGGFNLDYKLQSDFDLMLRLFEKAGIETRYVPEVLVRMRVGGATTGSFSNILKGNLEAARAYKEAGFSNSGLFMLRKIAGRVPQFFSRPTSLGGTKAK